MSRCPICHAGIPYLSLRHDRSLGYQLLGDIRPDQDVTGCIGCGAQMHTECVREFGRTLEGRFVRHADSRLREAVERLGLASSRLALCGPCYDRITKEGLRNLETAANLEEAAQLLEVLGRHEEAGEMRRRDRTHVVRSVSVDLNALVETLTSRGLAVQYRCPGCGASLPIGRGGSPTGVARCAYCGSALDTDAIMEILRAALAR